MLSVLPADVVKVTDLHKLAPGALEGVQPYVINASKVAFLRRRPQPPRPPKGTRWGGRAKGTPNKVNQSIREAIQMAFEQAGGVDYLVRLAQEDPKTFVPLLIKTMPPEPRVPQEGGLNIHIDLT